MTQIRDRQPVTRESSTTLFQYFPALVLIVCAAILFVL